VRRRVLIVAISACVVGLPPAARADHDPIRDLCGIARPVDALLPCEAARPASTAPTPEQPADAPLPTSGEAPPTLAAAGTVRSSSVTPRYAPDRALVVFRRNASRGQIAALLKRLGANLERAIPHIGINVVHVPPQHRAAILAALRRSPLIRTAQRDPLLQAFDTTPNDTLWPDQWGLRQLGLPQAWDMTRGAPGVIVAVIDTGVDGSHPDLRGAVLPGLDVMNGGVGAADDEGHGTAVAGIIAARTDNHAGQAGVCWNCALLPIKALDSNGVGDTSGIATGIVRAVDLGARVINLSLGGPVPAEALADAVAYAEQKGVLVVAAAGNNSGTTPFYPAAYPGVIAVAGSDADRRLYPWSDFGGWVQLAAPGCNVAPTRGGGYGEFCGTSSATPVLSGVAALAAAAAPAATPAQIVAALERTSAPIGAGVQYGEVQAAQTLSMLGIQRPATSPSTAMKGTLSPAAPTRTFTRAVASGVLTVKLVYVGTGVLTVSVRRSDGFRVARRSGRSPLEFAVSLAAGSYRFAVTGTRPRARFTLSVSNAVRP